MAFELIKLGIPFDIVKHIAQMNISKNEHLTCHSCMSCVLYLTSVDLFPVPDTEWWLNENCTTICTPYAYSAAMKAQDHFDNTSETSPDIIIDHKHGILRDVPQKHILHKSSNTRFPISSFVYMMEREYMMRNGKVTCMECETKTKTLQRAWKKIKQSV